MQISTPTTTDFITHSSVHRTTIPHHKTHFSDLINPRDFATDRTPKPPDDDLRQAASSLVAITLVQPLLAQVRQDPFRSELFHGGFAEDVFGKQLDSIIAERVTQAARFPVVNAVYNQIQNAPTKVNIHG